MFVQQAGDAGSVKEFIGPSNTCDFKILMEVNHEAGHYLKVKYDWINVAQGAEAKEITFPEIDTGYFRDWNLVQIEGEEPVSHEELDPKAKAAAAKKAPPAAKNQSKLEDITDNRPRIINYERDCAAENNGVGLDVTEEIAVKFQEAVLNIQIFDTNKETLEETLIDSTQIDLSCLLFQNGALDMQWKFDKMKPIQLNSLTVKIQSEKPLLSDFYRKKLNPLQINLVSMKDIPFKTEHKYKPITATLQFIDGSNFKTLEMP